MKLTKGDVLTIFAQRAQVNSHESNSLTSRQLAAKYGISERTVRDIWTRRSRTNITKPAWTMAEVEGDRLLKRKGRPVGAKDAGPRKRSGNSSSEQATNSSDSGSAQRDTSSSESGSAPRESSSSDGGTARQSDTTGSRNQTSGDSGENSNGSQQESASTSGRENSSSGSGDSSPRQCETSAAPSTSEQNARNAQLNQAVLSLINTDWRQSVAAQHAQNNIPAAAERQPLVSTPQTFAPTNIQGAFQSAPQFAQVGASQSLQQLLGQWQASQNPSPSPRNNASYGSSLQSALGYTQAQPAPNFAHQSPSPSPASTIAHAPPFQMAPWQMASRAAAPPQQSSAPSPGPFYVQDHAPATPALNQALFSLPLKRPPPCDYTPAPAPAQRCFKFESSTGPALPFQLDAPVPMLGGYGQSCPQPGPGILGGSYMPPHQNTPPQQPQEHTPQWQFNSHMPGHY